MSTDQGKNFSVSYCSEKLNCGTKQKVSSYTQVDPEFVGAEIRSIVGQEDIAESYLSVRLQEFSLQKQNKGVRPPLVGQASSSSNDSVSITSGKRQSDSENADRISPTYQTLSADPLNLLNLNDDGSPSPVSFALDNYTPPPYLLNRDDYISQRPPEGSSDQITTINQPPENVQEFHRIQSPSSASSVTSSRRLEWDSLADVGYNQSQTMGGKISEPGMSTLERMALVCGTNLLTRSDPEGTTGSQPQPSAYTNDIRSRFRNKLGFPNAESTPLATSDVSPETVSEEVISPISSGNRPTDNVVDVQDLQYLEIHETSKFKNETEIGSSPKIQKGKKTKIPLFPEVINAFQVTKQDVDGRIELSPPGLQQTHIKVIDLSSKTDLANPHLDFHIESKSLSFNSELNHKLLSLEKKSTSNKKLSSSLENVFTVNSELSDSLSHPNTLPRSQSQLHLNTDKFDLGTVEGSNANSCPKYSMALHSLVQQNKSASSSSIATVVLRKGDSPKHVFAQTSVLKLESVGIQVNDVNVSRHKGFAGLSLPFEDTPHIPKVVVSQPLPKRSNYINFDSTSEIQNIPDFIDHSQVLKSTDKIKIQLKNSLIHSHNGMPCTGAHRKIPCCIKGNNKAFLEDNTHNSNHGAIDNCISKSTLNQARPSVQGLKSHTNNKLNFGATARTIDSVESSAKSGECWTDKPYSVTVEDRVNSFEYLPGHVYENTERQPPVDSRGTSSISIQNQTSNIESPDEQGKIWDSSMSASSSLEKDVQRGIDIISDFVKGSCGNDSELKKKLIRRVVEKLITKNYDHDKIEPKDLTSNVPWVPSRPPNPIERNGRETRRSINRSKVPCEFSSHSEKSRSANASSECFIPRPAASSTFLPSSLRDNTCVTGQGSHSSTSEISIERSSKNHGKPQPLEVKAQVVQHGDITDSSSSKTSHGRNWREPTTRTEKLLEEKKKMQKALSSDSDAVTLTQYLNMERESQLFWIRSEIQHLSNLKQLLEKQEQSKRGMKNLKSSKQKISGKFVLRERNIDRLGNGRAEFGVPGGQNPTSKPQTRHRPTLSAWLENAEVEVKEDNSISSAVSTEGMEDWTSHHYESGKNENIRLCVKRKNIRQDQKEDKKISSDGRAIYDEPYRGQTEEVKHGKHPATPYRPKTHHHIDDSVFVTDKGITKKNVQTETLGTVGVQTSNSVQQLPVVHPNWFQHKNKLSQQSCHCKNSGREIGPLEEKKKPPVGYYIILEPSKEGEKPNILQRHLEEVRIPVPMSEPKQRPTSRLRGRQDNRERERIMEPRVSERVRAGADVGGSEMEESSRQSDKEETEGPATGQPIFQGPAGTLQYCLLRHRPDYVSRAEDRRQCIAQMQYLRELREQSKRRLLSLTEPTSHQQLPTQPLRARRVFSQQTMRKQTEKKYRQLSEVKAKQHDMKRKEGYRTNRLMAEIFNKKLQKRVLKGEVNLSNSVSIISNL